MPYKTPFTRFYRCFFRVFTVVFFGENPGLHGHRGESGRLDDLRQRRPGRGSQRDIQRQQLPGSRGRGWTTNARLDQWVGGKMFTGHRYFPMRCSCVDLSINISIDDMGRDRFVFVIERQSIQRTRTGPLGAQRWQLLWNLWQCCEAL